MQSHGAAVSQRQANGIAGQDLTKGFLGPFLRISEYNGDQDGADLLCEKPRLEFTNAKRVRVQSKFLIAGNSANVDLSYVESAGSPRKDFFLIVHVNNKGNIKSYFLTSANVIGLPRNPKRGPTFSGPKTNKYSEYLVSSWESVAKTISNSIDNLDAESNKKYLSEILLPFQMRSASYSRKIGIQYILKHIELPKRSEGSEDKSKLPIVIARSTGSSIVRAIDARWDLFDSTATWAWGYKGEGPRLTAWSILGHYFGGVLPTHDQFMLFLENCIARLDSEKDAVIETSQIEDALGGKPLSGVTRTTFRDEFRFEDRSNYARK